MIAALPFPRTQYFVRDDFFAEVTLIGAQELLYSSPHSTVTIGRVIGISVACTGCTCMYAVGLRRLPSSWGWNDDIFPTEALHYYRISWSAAVRWAEAGS